jgi:hypothetical protein
VTTLALKVLTGHEAIALKLSRQGNSQEQYKIEKLFSQQGAIMKGTTRDRGTSYVHTYDQDGNMIMSKNGKDPLWAKITYNHAYAFKSIRTRNGLPIAELINPEDTSEPIYVNMGELHNFLAEVQYVVLPSSRTQKSNAR